MMRLVLITDRRLMGAADAGPAAFGAAIAAAVRLAPERSLIVQVREKDLSGAALLRLVDAALEAVAGRQLVVVNERLDLALATGAAGVHLPEDGMDVAAARTALAAAEGRAVDPRASAAMLIGCSRHTLDGAVAAAHAGAGLVQLGPIFPTPSKSTFGPPLGLAPLRATRAALPSPSPLLVAVGGIDSPTRAAEARAAGADAVAVIRAVWCAADPSTVVRALL